MSNLYEEYGLEMESESVVRDTLPEGSTKNTKKKGGWLKAIIALFLGLVIGVGGVVGGGFILLNSPARPAIETIGGFAGLNYDEKVKNKLLAEEYESKTLLEIAKELMESVKNKNLAGVDKIAPAVGDYVDEMITNMNTQFGTEMDTEIVLKTEFSELPTYLGDTFRTTPMGKMLKATNGGVPLEPILMEVCYGEEGVHYHIDENGEVVMNEGYQAATFETFGSNPNSLINNVSVAAVLLPKADDSMMLSMAYGKENTTFVLEKDEHGQVKLDENGHPVVTMLPLYFEKEDDIFVDYAGEPVLCTVTDAENGFLKMERQPLFNGAGTDVYYLKETNGDGKYYAYKSPESTAEPASFKKVMIGNLAEDSSQIINNVYLKDALKVNYLTEPTPHKILFSLAYGTLDIDYTVDPVTKQITMINGAEPRTIGDLRERGNDIINDVAISDIMDANHNDALEMYLLYGKKDIHYELDSDDKVVMLQKYIAISNDTTRVYNEYGELLAQKAEGVNGYVLDTTAGTYTDNKGITYKYVLADPEKTIETNDGHLTPDDPSDDYAKVYYLTDEADVPAMFIKHSLGELAGNDNLISRMNDRLTTGELLGEEEVASNKFLKHLKDSSITDLPRNISNLTVGQVFEEEMYVTCQIYDPTEGVDSAVPSAEYDANGNVIMIQEGDYYYVDDNGNWHPAEGEKAIRGTWKYLLKTGKDSFGNDIYKTDYKVATDMNLLLNNMTSNVKTATLYELNNDGVMEFEATMLSTDIKTTVNGNDITSGLTNAGIDTDTQKKLGCLTTNQVLAYLSIVLALS